MQMQTLPRATKEVFTHSVAMALHKLTFVNGIETSVQMTIFHASRIPGIEIRKYVERIVTYAPCTVECFVVALAYLNRIAKYQGEAFINPHTVHRLFLTSVLLASKYVDDICYTNKYYARVGGILVGELNALEIEFLFRCQFDCNISAEEFHKFSYILYEPEAQDKRPHDFGDAFYTFSVSPNTHAFMFPPSFMAKGNRFQSVRYGSYENQQPIGCSWLLWQSSVLFVSTV